MTQAFAGRTPKGHELYREVGGDHWFVREPVKTLKALNTAQEQRTRGPSGGLGSVTAAGAAMEGDRA